MLGFYVRNGCRMLDKLSACVSTLLTGLNKFSLAMTEIGGSTKVASKLLLLESLHGFRFGFSLVLTVAILLIRIRSRRKESLLRVANAIIARMSF